MVEKIYAVNLVDGAHRVTGSLIDNEKGGFRSGRVCVDQIFTIKQIGENQERRNAECMWVS